MKGDRFFKVLVYILVLNIVFYLVYYITNEEAKSIKLSDLRNAEDWFLFIWLFGIPVLLDFLIVGLPISYGFSKYQLSRKTYVLLFFALIVEFLLTSLLYGNEPALTKVGLSIILFIPLIISFKTHLNYTNKN
ncbi:hypothetical protein ACFU8T_20565 [Sphingobacterium spiritivorum]|uniref:Uncharacterized protein n=1 Tax=Sphingobacterium spiritivorum ATCC 33861 TaxID=525373 RepID=D7VGE2_SPHSI|nr:hypothetical protein [Sphingobacterium spiritivorum]EFK60117.1 hypothetical protein HMPREF0766_10061 [Sphingobacterium spiritivorum ATCC 33861]QQT34830.1 hypothetical protein I6J01_16225 [Sphingobacterium spiritivorum]WQD35720.1 hypothetical protein U0038_08175 [Sphingobacterium spiritivorum]SUJ01528.1 Uncharacterised protein [Sphingobacterium spiritivorum]